MLSRVPITCISVFIALLSGADEVVPTFEQLESRGVVVGTITIVRENVFDTTNPNESKWFHERINQLHFVTREDLIRSQLLFEPGQRVSASAMTETARLLRTNRYLYEATISVVQVRDNIADILVTTRDIWTLSPEIKLSREGGRNYFTLGIEDDNFLGTGASLTVSRAENIDRTSKLFSYRNRNLFNSRLNFGVAASDNSDGNLFSIGLDLPFYALETRRAAGFGLFHAKSEETFYRNAQEVGRYTRDQQVFRVYRGWSTGRQGGWIKRLSTGFATERSHFAPPRDLTSNIGLPINREFYYPYISIDIFEDRFETTHNFRTIDRTEDVYLGSRYSVSLGLASSGLGSIRDAVLISAATNHSFGSTRGSLVSVALSTSGRIESGKVQNLRSALGLSYSYKPADKWEFYTNLKVLHSERTDLDRLTTLGGANDLRGYPVRYRNGQGNAVFTIEQRFFSNWYPFRLFRVGAAAFLDAGQVWGQNALGETNDDFLSDAGIGLRLGSTRGGSKKVIHIDVAFPLRNTGNIDSVQFLVEAKDSF